jgi:hypothetical protein
VARSGLYFRVSASCCERVFRRTRPVLASIGRSPLLPCPSTSAAGDGWTRSMARNGHRHPTTRTLQTSQPPVPAEPWVDLQKRLALAAHRNWGKDWTRTSGVLTYEQGVGSFRNINRLSASDKAKGGTLEKVYNWSSRG